jgi:hypothetical protein
MTVKGSFYQGKGTDTHRSVMGMLDELAMQLFTRCPITLTELEGSRDLSKKCYETAEAFLFGRQDFLLTEVVEEPQ